ncbi:MAG: DUF1178 family protein [Deltaproteobacteria bacterium]|nr:DUF1178 family protein [Deltaproteobacteria bacterium]MBW1940014.1 DUF1178 family protein [Deltaproteobacteria bacterium]MBW2010827.1 DUF1178 family protein [Deltaproteobacteria bacterium]MBW2099577.1 DUF1178 family protein [Deltaproteobacteria bacterium]
MIAFDLKCANGHCFEGWFEDSDAYEEQKKKGLIACPVCNDTAISKALSTFAIKKSARPSKEVVEHQAALTEVRNKLFDFINKNFDDVGSDFTKEALKIHYGVGEKRNIRGITTSGEDELLKEEGVDIIKIPTPLKPDLDS